ncbi:eukaryotic translation initiation factor 3 subunit [Purpureocillium lavendulum]|uniref:Eukaryotic translation initiation factor 3 subunit n=1 Tax=Purpureocillium lavendulum TaxID=1247861 RepID=A0AB34FPA2_9HYPO|nr:eukaryotic translation initiation factor 3 subunit [Purpureocillium lavendulum]
MLNQLSNIRVITFGYDADVSSFLSKTSDRSIFSIAQDLVTRLEMLRESTDRALKFSQDQLGFQNHLYSIFSCTYGVMFLGTPHRGSEFASVGKLAARIAGLGLAESDHKLLTALELGSPELQRIADSFSRMLPKQGKGMNVYSFMEALPLTGMSFAGKVVEEYSAIIGDACEGKATLQRDHLGLSRFSSTDDPDYQLVFGVIRRWAGSYIATTKLPVKDYVAKYSLQKEYLLQQKPPKALWRYGKTVFTTWEMSYETISQTQPLAAKLLLFCAYLQPDEIWFDIFKLGLEPSGRRAQVWERLWPANDSPKNRLKHFFQSARGKTKSKESTSTKYATIDWLRALCADNVFEAAVAILHSYSIISLNTRLDGMSMHTLVHEWCRYRASDDRHNMLRDVLLTMGRTFDKTLNDWVNMEWDVTVRLARHVPTVVAAVQQLENPADQTLFINIDACHALEAIGDASGLPFSHFVPAEATLLVYKQLYDVCSAALKPGHQLLLVAMGDYSLWLENLERYDEAVPLAKLRLELYKRSLGPKHPDTLSSMSDLGKGLKMSGDHISAEPILREAVVLRGDSPSAATPMTNLAMVLVDKGEVHEAKQILESALDIVTRSGNLVLQLECSGCLAWCAADSGDQNLALTYLEQAVSLAEQRFGPDSPAALEWTGQKYYHIVDSVALSSQDDITAVETGIQSLIERLGTTETRRVNRFKLIVRLGDLYYRIGSFDKSIDAFHAALRETESTKTTAKSNENMEEVLISLGRVYWDSGRLQEGIACYERCIEHAAAASSKSSNALVAGLNRAIAFRDRGELSLAEKSLGKYMKPSETASLDWTNMARIYTLQGRTLEAQETQAELFEKLGDDGKALGNLLIALEGKQALLASLYQHRFEILVAMSTESMDPLRHSYG